MTAAWLKKVFNKEKGEDEIVSVNENEDKNEDENVPKLFSYKGFEIPLDLMYMTGGGYETWDEISMGHREQLQKYCAINPAHNVLEVGCGVGRDAILLTEQLSDDGSYTGVDIIKPSIEWCQGNIASRYTNFSFHYLDIHSQIHNPEGSVKTTEVRLPAEDGSIDRIILHSVFTHMFEDDIVHYLHEFARVLKPGGKVFASFFILDEEALVLLEQEKQKDPDSVFEGLDFKYEYGDGCYVQDLEQPEGAVAFTQEAFEWILKKGNMKLACPVGKGFWCGREGVTDGQDITILEPVSE